MNVLAESVWETTHLQLTSVYARSFLITESNQNPTDIFRTPTGPMDIQRDIRSIENPMNKGVKGNVYFAVL